MTRNNVFVHATFRATLAEKQEKNIHCISVLVKQYLNNEKRNIFLTLYDFNLFSQNALFKICENIFKL